MTVLYVSLFLPLRDPTPNHGRFNTVKKHGVFPGYSTSRRIFLRLRFLASACFARRLSPGFR